MAEHLSQETLTRYAGRALSPTELLAADDHLAACAACRERLENDSEARAVVQALRAESAATPFTHLDYEQLEAVVDGTAGEVERQMVSSHTQVCAACAGELNELMALKAQLQARVASRDDAAEVMSQPEAHGNAEPAPVVSLKAYQQQREARRQPRAWLTRWAAAAAALAACALVAWVVWRPSPEQVAGVNRNPGVSEPAANSTSPNDQRAAADHNASSKSAEPAPPPASPAVVALNDGTRRVTLDAEGRLAGFDGLAPETAQAVRLALERQRVEAPAGLAAITENAGTLMSGAGDGIAFKLISPIGTAVRSARPVFRWQPLAGATSYVVKVFDAGFNRVAMSEPLATTAWTPSQPLAVGAIYSWQVTAAKDGGETTSPAPPAPQARFKVIEGARLAELRHAEQSYPDSHLLRGVLYARAGLLDDAERELQALLKANPANEAARKLLASVHALRQKR
ncbi:MAG TPA: hypothetical protein VJ464_25340 [Blastocatellia bacterium]|nr:hypothetical protein [Blastocatellia bacterium]